MQVYKWLNILSVVLQSLLSLSCVVKKSKYNLYVKKFYTLKKLDFWLYLFFHGRSYMNYKYTSTIYSIKCSSNKWLSIHNTCSL